MKSSNTFTSLIFYFSAFYDGILGMFFLIFPKVGFDFFNVTHPNHWGYVQFPAALLVVFGFMFFAIARNPLKERNLIPYGIGLKVSYCAVVFGYWFTKGLPDMWKPFAVIDFFLGILFVFSYLMLGKQLKDEG
ncbi:MAG: hypothetical protein B5M53_05835 [Candidatus Cloacimonas sp. 4484_209]|nr:MAG: hypothetical protein B5M53_05835 [Candidatus Cloacimonas sp. 4484_209]